MYKIKDTQQTGEYFANGVTFKTLKEIKNQLVSYHYDVEGIEKMSLNDILEVGGWEIEKPTRVIFRKWVKGYGKGEIIALFPDLNAEANTNRIESYMHIGQHAEADYLHVIRVTKPAQPEEYADLKAELESIGYNLKICKRR